MAHKLNLSGPAGMTIAQAIASDDMLELSVSKLKIGFLILSLVLFSGCGRKQAPAPWPATVRFEGLTQSEINSVRESLNKFSDSFGSEVFFFDERVSQFQISIGKLGNSEATSSKAGLATFDDSSCKVELNNLIFQSDYSSYLEPVVWHELGHCAGMEHNPKSGELMYHIASPQSLYTEEAIHRFWSAFSGLTGIFTVF